MTVVGSCDLEDQVELTQGGNMRDRRERFVALAEARTDKAINAIRLIGNLSNRSNYDYTDVDVAQIVKALEAEVRAVKTKFADAGSGRESSFRLNVPNHPRSAT